MKTRRFFFLLAAMGAVAAAGAGQPVNGDALGVMRATMDFCTETNPDGAASYQEIVKGLVEGLTEEQVAKVLESAEYRAAYDDISAKLEEISDEAAAETCAAFVKRDERT